MLEDYFKILVLFSLPTGTNFGVAIPFNIGTPLSRDIEILLG